MKLFSRQAKSALSSQLDSPEGVVEALLSNKKSIQEKALDLILDFENNDRFTLKDQITILKSCGSTSGKHLTQIVQQHLMSSHQGIQDACLEILQQSLSRPERKIIIEDLMERDEKAIFLAIQLSLQWNSRVYGELIEVGLENSNPTVIIKTIQALASIGLASWIKKFRPLLKHEHDDVRLTLANCLGQQTMVKVDESMIVDMLSDSLESVRMMAIKSIRHQLNPSWIKILVMHLQQSLVEEEEVEVIKTIGECKSAKALKPLLKKLLTTTDQGLRWAYLQALDNIPEKARLAFYEEQLSDAAPETLPILFELIGNCTGEGTYHLLKKSLDQYPQPELQCLIASAMGTCGHPDCEQDLLRLMDGDVAVAYTAASALKDLTKGKAMAHFDNYLKKPGLDNLIKQIILQHIAESADSVRIDTSLRDTVESLLQHENENIRYLSIIACGAIGSRSSLYALIPLVGEEWTKLFKSELYTAIEHCCRHRLSPILSLIHESEQTLKNSLIRFISHHALIMNDDDLNDLSQHEDFKDWSWDEDLLHCIERTHQKDPSFIWRQFKRPNLTDRLCCFLARGFHDSSPNANELVDPDILIQCFHRFQTEKPLLLLGKLMSSFPRSEFLPPLIQYSENADPDTEMIFKSYVHKIVMSLSQLPD